MNVPAAGSNSALASFAALMEFASIIGEVIVFTYARSPVTTKQIATRTTTGAIYSLRDVNYCTWSLWEAK